MASPEFISSCLERSIFFLLIVVMSVVMKVYFRAIAACFGDPTSAQSVAGVTLMAFVLYTGYNIPEPYMIGALRWIADINVCIPYHVGTL